MTGIYPALLYLVVILSCLLIIHIVVYQYRLLSSYRYLLGITAFFLLNTSSALFDFYEGYEKLPHISLIILLSSLLFPPLIFCYIKSLAQQRIVSFKMYYWLPVALVSLIFLPYFTASADYKLAFMRGEDLPEDWRFYSIGVATIVFSLLLLVLPPIYFYFSYKTIKKQQEIIKQSFSYLEIISLRWLMRLLTCTVMIWLVYIIGMLIDKGVTPNNQWFLIAVYIFIFMCLIYAYHYTMQYEAITKALALDNTIAIPPQKTEESDHKTATTYEKSAIDSENSFLLYQQLQQSLVKEAHYLQPKLSLPKLANELGISTHMLSQVINQNTEGNFYDFINQYRLDHAKKLLIESEEQILSIALESGFNSKSAFYSVFKKQLGITPTQYRKKNKPS